MMKFIHFIISSWNGAWFSPLPGIRVLRSCLQAVAVLEAFWDRFVAWAWRFVGAIVRRDRIGFCSLLLSSANTWGWEQRTSSSVKAPAAPQNTFIILGFAGTTHDGETPDIMLSVKVTFCNKFLNVCHHLWDIRYYIKESATFNKHQSCVLFTL